MTDFLRFVFNEVKNGRLTKSEALERLRQFNETGPNVQEGTSPLHHSTEDIGTLFLEPCWEEKQVDYSNNPLKFGQHVVILCEPEGHAAGVVEDTIPNARCLELHHAQSDIQDRFEDYSIQIVGEIQSILREKPQFLVLFQVVAQEKMFAGLAGLLKSAKLENSMLTVQMIEMEHWTELVPRLLECKVQPVDDHVRYENGKRKIAVWKEITKSSEFAEKPWRDNGVYVITGGAGGLGLLFAEEIARSVRNPVLILTGRSLIEQVPPARLKKLEQLGAVVDYQSSDTTKKEDMVLLMDYIKQTWGKVNGIIHAAGVIRDGNILSKNSSEFRRILRPKTAGVAYLDEASKGFDLDVFIVFSSVAGSLGNWGQADYAAANAFMDAFAAYRHELVLSGMRSGRTLSINWPLWQEGGMEPSREVEGRLYQDMGMTPMSTKAGLSAFYQAMVLGIPQVMVLEGKLQTLTDFVYCKLRNASMANPPMEGPDKQVEGLQSAVQQRLLKLFGDVIKLEPGRVNIDEALEHYGLDSIIITRLNQRLNDGIGEISQTLFYECRTLRGVAQELVARYPQACLNWTNLGQSATSKMVLNEQETCAGTAENYETHQYKLGFLGEQKQGEAFPREPIAIIGMTGSYPMAENLDEFWANLIEGRDCISEIPEDRWALDDFYEPDPEMAVANRKSYSKWGGFLKGFAEFDPLFFNISPREAVNLDPQERLFLQTCWEVLEDAGYTRHQLAERYGSKVGVFAGITKTGFDLYGSLSWEQESSFFPYTSFGSLANRVSYQLNLKGPSMPVDTMCSASLTAIHYACEYLLSGEGEFAIAGGVNLYLHPSNYIGLCAQQMLSPEGKCRSFGKGASGFVPGEGVGAVLLKRLSRAEADGDVIHAVIRGTHINHGGRTNGYTVPDPGAQRELITKCIEKAGVPVQAISYIEAHGTGTELGDPIEIEGLIQAFRQETKRTGFCAIGSVKSSIGHLEAAAGMASLAKVVLQMKHQLKVPTLHARDVNPRLNLETTPFVLQQEVETWDRPILERGGKRIEYPRIAGISSFGAGGANAHIIVEEYIPSEPSLRTANSKMVELPVIFVLSAKNRERMREQIHRLLKAIREGTINDNSLIDAAYTLQIGREAMEERLAIIASSSVELQTKLESFLAGEEGIDYLYHGNMKSHRESLNNLKNDKRLQNNIDEWVESKCFEKVLPLWTQGVEIGWERLYTYEKPRRMRLPVYPFAKQRYWLPSAVAQSMNRKALSSKANLARLQSDDSRIPVAKDRDKSPTDFNGETDVSETTTSLLMPIWKKGPIDELEPYPIVASRVGVVGETPEQMKAIQRVFPGARSLDVKANDQIDDIVQKLKAFGQIDHFIWVAPVSGPLNLDDEALIQAQQEGVLAVFRIVKALFSEDYDTGALEWTLITTQSCGIFPNDPIFPAHSGIHGLVGSLAKECPGWKIRLLDLEYGEGWPLEKMFFLPEIGAEAWAYRGRRWYRQHLVEVKGLEEKQSQFRHGGVYVVIGGAGGIGEAWSEYMIRTYAAKIVWIGRRPLDDAIREKITRLEEYGSGPMYIQADATIRSSLEQAYQEIKSVYSRIHGIIHSAIVLEDQSIAFMQERQLSTVLKAKVDVCVRMAQVFQKEPLEIVLFFSGMISFSKYPGQSNYAAACLFKDMFAREMVREWPCNVKVMHWGYWGSVGIVADPNYRERMSQAGFGSIEPSEAMRALEMLVSHPIIELGFVKSLPSLVLEKKEDLTWVESLPAEPKLSLNSLLSRMIFPKMPLLDIQPLSPGVDDLERKQVEMELKQRVMSLLNLTSEDIEGDSNWKEWGFDHVTLIEFTNMLNEMFTLNVSSADCWQYATLGDLASFLMHQQGN